MVQVETATAAPAPEAPARDPEAPLVLVAFGKRDGSIAPGTPFATKIDLALRIAGVPFEGCTGNVTNRAVAPKHKLPVVHHGGTVVSDSSAIFEYLLATYPDAMAPFRNADALAQARGVALQALIEEDLYWCFMYGAWQLDDGWARTGPALAGTLPIPGLIKPLIMRSVRKGTVRSLHGQGIGRHTWPEVQARTRRHLAAVTAHLDAGGPFLTGAAPTQADCTLFGMLELLLHPPGEMSKDETPLDAQHPTRWYADAVREHPTLIAFHRDLRERYYPGGKSTQFEATFDPKTGRAAEAKGTPSKTS